LLLVGGQIKKRNICVLALVCAAATLALSAIHPELSSWRFYAGMPGLYIGMVMSWVGLLHSFQSIYFLSFLINALVYYGLIRIVLVIASVKAQ
jgi:hypothetical protein